jgi:hypothetical protein
MGPWPSSSPGWSSRPSRVDAATVTGTAAPARLFEVAGGEGEEGVGAALVGGPRVEALRLVDDPVQPGHQRGGAVGGQQRPQLARSVVLRGGHDPPRVDGVAVLLLGLSRIEREDGAFHRLPEVPDRLSRCCGQDPLLDLRGRRVVQAVDRLDQRAGMQQRDVPTRQRGQRGRQPLDQLDRVVQPGPGGTRRQAQHAGDLLPHPLSLDRLAQRRDRYRLGRQLREHPLLLGVDPGSVTLQRRQQLQQLVMIPSGEPIRTAVHRFDSRATL